MPARLPPVRRSYRYNLKLIRCDLSYSIPEIAGLFGLHSNAVRRWIKEGLPTIDDRRPRLVHGSDLIDHLGCRQRGRKRPCAPGEMYCCRCRAPRRPAEGKVSIQQINARQITICGHCELCGARMNRFGMLLLLSALEGEFHVTARSLRLDETTDTRVECDLRKETGGARVQPEK